MMRSSGRPPAIRRAQRGVVLLISLVLLIALTLGGIALFRQVTTGVLIASNLTFKNAALVASDRGVEAARNWLVTSGANLQQASLANGYFPGWCNTTVDASNNPDADGNGVVDDCKASPPPSEFNPATYNWANSVLVTNDDGNGNAIRYVIHRLCRIPGSLNYTNPNSVPQECVTLGSSTTGGTKGSVAYGGGALTNTMQPYFRITTQAIGPKNTIAYSQAIMY
jgi:Tfp pilus assembly protein PilX